MKHKMTSNTKRMLAKVVSVAILITSVFSVPLNGQKSTVKKVSAATTNRVYHAMVGFQTSKYDFRDGYETMEADQLYNEWREENGKNVPDYHGVNIYLNGNHPSLEKDNTLSETSAKKAELYEDAYVEDAEMNEDGTYTVSINDFNAQYAEENEGYFNMLNVSTDIVKGEGDAPITMTASSIKVNGEVIAEDVELPVRPGIKAGDYYRFMIADTYVTSGQPLYYTKDDSDTTLKVPQGTFDMEITYQIHGVDWTADEENQAFLTFTDNNWQWDNWNTKIRGGIGKDALITGNGTYTVSINKRSFLRRTQVQKPVNGANVFYVDIVGICNTQKFDASEMAVSDVIVKCDGEEIPIDISKMYEGDIEGKGNYRLEICNEYGYSEGEFDTKTEFERMNPDFAFQKSLSVTFTITGIKKGTTPADAFRTADDTSVVEMGGERAKRVAPQESVSPVTPGETRAPESAVPSVKPSEETVQPSDVPVTKFPQMTQKPDGETGTEAPKETPKSTVIPVTETPEPTKTPKPTVRPEEENKAFLMFADKEWAWSNFKSEVSGGVGKDVTITGNGTYTVSLDNKAFGNDMKAANGALVFCVDIMGICYTQKFDASEMAISNVIVTCDDKEIPMDISKMYEGNEEGLGNYRLEIRNEYGYGEGDFLTKEVFDEMYPDFSFKNSLSVTFTVTGIKEGKTPADAFETIDGQMIVEPGGSRAQRVEEPQKSPTAEPQITLFPELPQNSPELGTASSLPVNGMENKEKMQTELPATTPGSTTEAAGGSVSNGAVGIKNLKAGSGYKKKSGYFYKKVVKLSWDQAENSDGFYIYRRGGISGEKRIADISAGDATEYTDVSVKMGESYTYRVLPYVVQDTGEITAGTSSSKVTVKIGTTIKRPKAKVKRIGKRMILTFSTAEGDRYESQYRWIGEKKWKNQSRIKGKIKKKVKKPLNAGGFLLRVRCYSETNGKKIYSKWSSPMKVK